MPDSAVKIHEIVHRFRRKILDSTSSITTTEGEAPVTSVIAVVEFPSMEAVNSIAEAPVGRTNVEPIQVQGVRATQREGRRTDEPMLTSLETEWSPEAFDTTSVTVTVPEVA